MTSLLLLWSLPTHPTGDLHHWNSQFSGGPGQFWSSGSRFLIFDLNFRENFSEPTSAKIVGFHGLWSLKNSWKRFPNEIPAWCHLQRVAENSFFIKDQRKPLYMQTNNTAKSLFSKNDYFNRDGDYERNLSNLLNKQIACHARLMQGFLLKQEK